jgi:hypothetical protein
MDRKFLSIGMMAGTAVEKYRILQKGCCETWIPMCDKVYLFCGKHYDFDFEGQMVNLTDKVEFVHFNDVGENYESASPKFWRGLCWMMENCPAKWYAVFGSDNYVRYDRLVKTLEKFDGDMPLVIGGPMQYRCLKGHGVDYQIGFHIGGGGNYISHAALEMILNKYNGDRETQVGSLLDNWRDICLESNRPDLLPACDVTLCNEAWLLDIPLISINGFSPINHNGVQTWKHNNCYFTHNKDNIIVCHNMSYYDLLSYHKELGYVDDISEVAKEYIDQKYKEKKDTVSDINEHIPTLYEYTRGCKSVCEIGVRGICSTYSFLKGLAESATPEEPCKLYCVDIDKIDMSSVIDLAKNVNVDLEFIQADSAKLILPTKVSLCFIDSWHVGGHLRRELKGLHASVEKYICLHDVEVDGVCGESIRLGQNLVKMSETSGYPIWEIAQGLQVAIDEFLEEHPEWVVEKRFTNNNGLLILKRISE